MHIDYSAFTPATDDVDPAGVLVMHTLLFLRRSHRTHCDKRDLRLAEQLLYQVDTHIV